MVFIFRNIKLILNQVSNNANTGIYIENLNPTISDALKSNFKYFPVLKGYFQGHWEGHCFPGFSLDL
jgi:hypothetical protein